MLYRYATNYQKFHHNVRAAALYDPDDPAISGLLNDMATMRFKKLGTIHHVTWYLVHPYNYKD